MKKYLYVFFAFLACLFVSQNVHASSPSYDVLYYGGTLTLDNWDDATYEEELVYYFKDLKEEKKYKVLTLEISFRKKKKKLCISNTFKSYGKMLI